MEDASCNFLCNELQIVKEEGWFGVESALVVIFQGQMNAQSYVNKVLVLYRIFKWMDNVIFILDIHDTISLMRLVEGWKPSNEVTTASWCSQDAWYVTSQYSIALLIRSLVRRNAECVSLNGTPTHWIWLRNKAFSNNLLIVTSQTDMWVFSF